MRYSVIIPSAGSGSRMGADVPKVLLRIGGQSSSSGRSILQRTVDIFAQDARCEQIVVCVPAAWQERFTAELREYPKVSCTAGGETRQESVRLGVEALAMRISPKGKGDAPIITLVHDAARCFVSQAVIDRVVEGVRQHGAVTAGVRVPDSLGKIDEGGVITDHLDRKNVWAIQTPQGFILEELKRAHESAKVDGFSALDDTGVVARIRPVQVVEGDIFNIKVTHPQDLSVAERLSV